jgi:hypothetical protein
MSLTEISQRQLLRCTIRAGALCTIAFTLLALLGNPFVPDICASKGYGYPLPVYISWCECFIEGYPPSVKASFVLIDALFWGALWSLATFAFYSYSKRRAAAQQRG